ncbi:MAG: hypothetical protein L0177_03775 [Chloroflexi bacterium]|nr:hypothetical protein [Chloroflexota bacterium]
MGALVLAWRQRLAATLTDPASLLRIGVYLAAYFNLSKLILDQTAFVDPDDLVDALAPFFNDLFTTVVSASLLIGVLAIYEAARGRRSTNRLQAPTWRGKLDALLTSPASLLRLGIYATAYVGILHVLFETLEETNDPAAQIFSGFFQRLFFTSAAVFFLVALKVVVDFIEGRSPRAGGDSWQAKLGATLSDPPQLLIWGIMLTAYIGLLHVSFRVWSVRDAPEAVVWNDFFQRMLLTAIVVGFLLIARAIIFWLHACQAPQETVGESLVQRVVDLFNQPHKTVQFVFVAIIVLSLAYLVVFLILWQAGDLQTFRGAWRIFLNHGFKGVTVLAFLLALRAAALQFGADGVSDFRRNVRSAPAEWWNDPGQVLRIAAYTLAYIGLANLAYNMWLVRDRPVEEVWYYFFVDMGFALAIGIIVGFRALYGQLGSARDPNAGA